jgi:hypothetical protein
MKDINFLEEKNIDEIVDNVASNIPLYNNLGSIIQGYSEFFSFLFVPQP